MAEKKRTISIIVPVFNERENVRALVERVAEALEPADITYELIVVDDGSTDGTFQTLREIQAEYLCLKIVQLRRNFGQTAALAAGFDFARGEVIVPLDGDLQNDPVDIPRLLKKLDEGYDVVSGWRRRRRDPLLTRKLPSWLANFFISKITGIKLHDYGCTLKAYRRDVVQQINLYGEMHRFLPAIAGWSGARVTELEVTHHPRRRGTSKYGLSRTMKVVLDLLTVKFLGSFSTKPLHIFGGFGIVTGLLAIVSGATVLYQKFIADPPLSMNRNPLLVMTTMLLMMSLQFLLMGLLAEMLCRTYHESQNKPTYLIRQVCEPQEGSRPLDHKGEDHGQA